MKEFLKFSIVISSLCLICLHANAEGNKSQKGSASNKNTAEPPPSISIDATPDNFRCEKFREGGISELKLKMLENCDLNRPFSSSLSLFAGEETILYCCHKKAAN
jgi:hypothetical protein